MQDVRLRKPRGGPILPIPAPAHLRPFEPSFEKGKVLGRKTKGALALRQGQECHHRAALKAARGQGQQARKPGEKGRLFLPLAISDAVGQRKGDLGPAEYRFDEGRVVVDIGNHHHHILGPKGGIGLEGVHQGVVKGLNFPERTGARQKAKGGVLEGQPEGRIIPDQHGLLELSQRRLLFPLPKVVEHLRRPIKGQKLIQKLAPEGPILGQQGVGREVGQGRRLVSLQRLRTAVLQGLGLAPRHHGGAQHLRPVIRRGV